MEPRDRRFSLILFGLAAAAWVVVAAVALLVDPLASPTAGFIGAGALGTAMGVTTIPLVWLAAFTRNRRIAYRGDWTRAVRRGAWIGILVAVFVIMRLNGIFQPQIGLFLIAMAIAAEITLTAGSGRRG